MGGTKETKGGTYLVRVGCPCSSSLSSISSTNSIRERSVFLKSQRYASPVESNARTIWLVETEVSLKKHIGQSATNYLFLGWNDAEITGASKRIVQCRCGGSQAEARSQTSTFQSLDEVKTYREFRDQLRQKNQLPKGPYKSHQNKGTYSILVTPLTCPSNHRMGARVSRSQISAEPIARPAAMNLPVVSKRAICAPAKSEV